MTIGPDIKEVLSEVGTAFTIVRDSGNITGEYLDFTPNSQVTKPFIREYFLEIMLSYDTVLEVGEVITLNVPNVPYMVTNKTPDMFENEVIKYDGIIYKCNVSGELLRPSGEADWDDTSYKRRETFVTIQSDSYALLVAPLHGGEIDTDEPMGLIHMDRQELYIPSSAGIRELDRYQPVSGEYYRVEGVKKRLYPGVDVCILGEDTR